MVVGVILPTAEGMLPWQHCDTLDAGKEYGMY